MTSLRVTRLRASCFARFEALDLELPETGLVLVSGRNGHGKSTLIDVVAAAAWGQHLQADSPWRAGEAGSVEILTPDFEVRRQRSAKGTLGMRWRPAGDEEWRKGPTSKSADLASYLPPWEVWRTSCVFGEDGAGFATGAAGERKRLLERLLVGEARWDAALKLCRQDKGSAEKSVTKLEERLAGQERLLSRERQALADALAAAGAAPVAPDLNDLAAHRSELEAEAMALEYRRRALHDSLAAARAAADVAERRVRVTATGTCDACASAIAEERQDELAEAAALAKVAAAEVEKRVSAELDSIAGQQRSVAEDHRQIRALEAEQASQRAAYAAAQQAYAKASATADRCRGEVERLEGERAGVVDELGEARAEAAELRAVDLVLGLQGARTVLLARAFSGLQDAANSVLGRLAPDGDLRVQLSVDGPILVTGGGAGATYGTKSRGYRRRVDLALLLGLAWMSDAAAGRAAGDLWFDEVFDGLDAEGIEAAASEVRELAKERKVVVISHNPDLLAALVREADLRLRVEGGRVEAR